jgi:RNA polymerase sigma-70 factor, ECF subfamily
LGEAKTAAPVVALDANENFHSGCVDGIERDQVRNAIQQLPLEAREIIVLREYEGLSCEEIGALLGCPVGTVMSRLARARSKLIVMLRSTSIVPVSENKGTDDNSGTTP